MKINFKVIFAIMKRDLRRYFTSPAGYVFITLFIFLSAAAAFWQQRFFLNNLANLDQLNALFPYLLIFFIPALTMAVWAEEKKQGTDELLLTLPAKDIEIVLGKYVAVMGVYTASLVLSLSHIFVLFWLGSPDIGLMFANFFGYWLLGGALITIGMLGSLLTDNMTIGFIVGAIFCSFFVFVEAIGSLFGTTVQRFIAPLGVIGHFEDFARGIISFSGLLYFFSLAGAMLFINVILISKRHWPIEADGFKMWVHHLIRVVAVVVALISVNMMLHRVSFRLDATAEQLHSLSGETKRLLKELPDNRPVFIQAFISKDVPQAFVQTRSNLIGFLKEISAAAGQKVQVWIHDTEPFSKEARDAREKFGITFQEVPDIHSATASLSQIFMGVAVTSGAEEQVIPFFDRGLPVEYELVRSIRIVTRADLKTVGILNTEARLFGGLDFQTMRGVPSWLVVDELKKQYEVVQLSANTLMEGEELDGLLVALPSTMSQDEMDRLLEYIKAGNPTLLLIDPLPAVNIGLSPSEKSGASRNPFMRQQGPPPTEKGDIERFMTEIGVSWNKAQIVWDRYNPHPEFAEFPPEIVFVGQGNENPECFNPGNNATSGLQELVLIFPGSIEKASGTKYEFTPLMESGMVSGAVNYHQMIQRSFFGMTMNTRGIRRVPSEFEYILAAQITGEILTNDSADAVDESQDDLSSNDSSDSEISEEGDSAESVDKAESSKATKSLNVIVIADIDFISSQFFEIRKRGIEGLAFDNVTFFLNCMDTLVGDESFVELRKRRVKHRTLTTVEKKKQDFILTQSNEEQEAEAVAQSELTKAQQRLEEKVSKVLERTDLDEQTKQIMAQNLQETEQKRFDALKDRIEAEKKAKIQSSKENMESQIRRIQNNIKTFAVLAPPIPVFFLGVWIFLRRRKREKEGAIAARRLRS